MGTDIEIGTHTPAELLHFLTQPTRFAIIANILQHPDQLPSLYELEQCNPDISEATVYKHVQKCIDVGVLEAVTLPDEKRQQGLPWTFYTLTDDGRAFLEDHRLLEAEDTFQAIYETIEDKPEKMIRYENAPRPEQG
ncbi:MAG: MarR family winged helix-turn-helix transcriptional regulator [Natrialbaceae archaeon]|nr:MarR family winged helix-turn-helix transcriptional regulator [Natrialbaceae archaeon]